MIKYEYYGRTDIGNERKVNQDSLGITKLNWGSAFIISDGFGHKKGGQFASKLTVKTFLGSLSNKKPTSIKQYIFNTFKKINDRIYFNKVSKYDKAMLGCTAVAIIAENDIAHVTHIGDSRAYLIRNNELIQLTKDHSYVQNLIDTGKIEQDQAMLNTKKHVLTRALGGHKNIEPSYRTHSIIQNDKFILCSDGVWGFISEESLLKIIDNNSADEAVSSVIDTVKRNKGSDNITIQVMHFK